jgi:hypothetical protein
MASKKNTIATMYISIINLPADLVSCKDTDWPNSSDGAVGSDLAV